ncbi:TonB-dependent receptor [Paraburkholderia hayleyella]|uniref:TonB-dependent receptor n=1 Tax=Paraburkholderia hayleyella TaxID=2152889 RepID=UPI0012910BDD|nr:TonB-dependent siderophore receptor [Paraburkholderia hayleyella]
MPSIPFFARPPSRSSAFSPALIAAGFALSASALAQPASDVPTLAPITVSADKREQAVKDINGSVARVGAQALDDAQVHSTAGLARVLPGVQISEAGSELFPIVSVRGVASAQDFYNPAVTFYIDGVPQLPTFSLQTLTDVEQVELLRGPQGTLYGKSAEGGVIDIVTRKPDGETLASVDGGLSSRHGYYTKGNISGALKPGLLYGSLSVVADSQPGNLSNPASGSSNLGGVRNQAGAARLRLAPEGKPWEINVGVSAECSRAQQDVYLPFNAVDTKTLSSASPGTPDPRMHRCSNSESLAGSYRFGDWRLSGVAAWQNVHFSRTFPYGPYLADQPERWRQNTQEIKLATQGKGRPWDAVFGLYRQDVMQQRTSTFYQFTPTVVPGAVTRSNNDSQTLAVYGDGTWHVTPAFDLGGGVRVSRDSANTRFDNRYLGALQFDGDGSDSRYHVLGQLSAGYWLTPAWRVYARIAQGYKPLGYNLAPAALADARPFAAQTSMNYELGARYEHGDVSLQAALFRTQTRDMQLYVGAVGAQTIRNAGHAYANGLEFNTGWRFLPGWSLGLDGTAAAAKFSRFDAGNGISYGGNRVPFVPRYSFGAHLQGRIGTRYGALRPGLDVRSVGPQDFDVANSLSQPSYTTVDVRLGWRPNSRIELTAYALNLTNRLYRTYAFTGGPGLAYAQINMGRTVGVNLHLDFF